MSSRKNGVPEEIRIFTGRAENFVPGEILARVALFPSYISSVHRLGGIFAFWNRFGMTE